MRGMTSSFRADDAAAAREWCGDRLGIDAHVHRPAAEQHWYFEPLVGEHRDEIGAAS